MRLAWLGVWTVLLGCGPSPSGSGTTSTTLDEATSSGSVTSTTGTDPLTVYSCDDPAMGLGEDAGEALTEVGFTRCAMVTLFETISPLNE